MKRRLTLGENTAGNGGLRFAYLALLDDPDKKNRTSLADSGRLQQTQQFFVGFAQIWCENDRPETARLQVQTDPHSPAQFRLDGRGFKYAGVREGVCLQANGRDVGSEAVQGLVDSSSLFSLDRIEIGYSNHRYPAVSGPFPHSIRRRKG